MNPKIITIGVYGFTEEHFFGALRDAGVDTFVDIRRRRGVRGSRYPFANSACLQKQLANMGIRYLHMLDLAPTHETRSLQKQADKLQRTATRQRQQLSQAFVRAYEQQALSDFDANAFLDRLGPDARVVALFCVEGAPEACHRSLVAARLHRDLGLEVEHITP